MAAFLLSSYASRSPPLRAAAASVVRPPRRLLLRAQLTRRFSATSRSEYEFIETTRPRTGVTQRETTRHHMLTTCRGLPFARGPGTTVETVTLNRPKALNALSTALVAELNSALRAAQAAEDVGAVVLTGSERAFAAGADIREMAGLTFADAYKGGFIESWSDMASVVKKPVIAAVSGHALGGGCELALMCDIVYCTEAANFGQPEIKLGTIPGAGGSQRLTRAVGKSRAMELILTGKGFSGREAYEWGVAARCYPTHADLMGAALDTAETIAGFSRVAVMAAKEVVNKSQDLGLRDGVDYERRVFHGLFGSKDQKVGMAAFAEKRKPEWTHE